MSRASKLSLLVVTLTVFAGCTGLAPSAPKSGEATEGEGEGDGASEGEGGEGEGASEGEGADGGDSGQGGATAGTLTAGAWDDNRNYDFFVDYLDTAGQLDGTPSIPRDARDAAHDLFAGDRAARSSLDVAIVLDTTGSMGDEMAYVTVELNAIAGAVDAFAQQTGAADVRWALVLYKDVGDEYVTRSADFGGVDAVQDQLDDEYASGGGDTPEADDAALAAAMQLSWRGDADVARMVFWIGDASHHAERADDMTDAIVTAAASDVHLYPVSASGADALLELTMRSAAQLTGGRYLFLTDDSGVGGAHLEPSVPCYFVTRLDDAMVRMVKMEMSGVYVEPTADEILRTGGDPQNGACTLSDGSVVNVF